MLIDLRDGALLDERAMSWRPNTGVPTLHGDEVHVWRAHPPPAQERLPLCHLLSQDERTRAARFQRGSDCYRFIWGRAFLRMLLARYLQTKPDLLRFTYGPHGKPELPGEGLPGFNVAHSGSLVLISIASTKAVGVDVERVRDDIDLREIASHVYTPSEYRAAATLPLARGKDTFFTCWTRKEAWLKARGAGLTVDPTTFSVPLGPIPSVEILHTATDTPSPIQWTLWTIDPGDGYKGAVAVRGADWKMHCWDWQWTRTNHPAQSHPDDDAEARVTVSPVGRIPRSKV